MPTPLHSPHVGWTTDILPLDAPEARARWDALRAASAADWAYGSASYAAVIADTFALRPELILVGHDGRDEAGLLAFARRRGPFVEAVVPPLTAHTPVVLRTPPSEHAVNSRASATETLLEAVERRYDRVRLHLAPDLHDVRCFQWRGWRASPLYTYRLALDAEGRYLDAWSDGPRRLLRRDAVRFTHNETTSAADAAALYDASYGRHGRAAPVPAAVLARLMERLCRAGELRIFTATPADEDVPTAAVGIHQAGPLACLWMAGSRPGASMTILMGHVLEVLSTEGVQQFDFVGANTPSIANFKRRLGGSLVPYFAVTRTRSKLLRLVGY